MTKTNFKVRKVVEPDLTVIGCYDLEAQYSRIVTDMLIEQALEED